jgi:hypothetical protein
MPKRKAEKIIKRQYPHMTVKQEEFYINASSINFEQELEKLKKPVENEYSQKPWEWFRNDLLAIKHPEVIELLRDPCHIPDPDDIIDNFCFMDQQNPGRPKTNVDIYGEIYRKWSPTEMEKTPEYKAYKLHRDKVYKYESQIRGLKEKQEKLKKLRGTIVEKQPQILPDDTMQVLSRFISVSEGKKEKKIRNRKDKGHIKALIIPLFLGDTFEKIMIMNNSDDFGEPVFTARIGAEKKNNIVATITFNNEILVRQDKYQGLLIDSLIELGKDPEGFLSSVGKRVGFCLMCSKPLTDENSRKLGYGPICARFFRP